MTNADLLEKYSNQSYSDDLRNKIREIRTEFTNYTLLHLAALNCRGKFCEYLINEFEIGKFLNLAKFF